jgi:hypothetical protein
MRCPRTDEHPVVTEWQLKVLCPNCKHYSCGECNNPQRKEATDPCPIKNLEFKEVTDTTKFKMHQEVTLHGIAVKIRNMQMSTIGMLYEVETADKDRRWVPESFLE